MGLIFYKILVKYSGLRTQKNNDETRYVLHVKFIVKTDCFDTTDPEVLHILVKTVYFERFGHVCDITLQQNCCLGCNSLKNIVF